jgi:hypothetical protein
MSMALERGALACALGWAPAAALASASSTSLQSLSPRLLASAEPARPLRCARAVDGPPAVASRGAHTPVQWATWASQRSAGMAAAWKVTWHTPQCTCAPGS